MSKISIAITSVFLLVILGCGPGMLVHQTMFGINAGAPIVYRNLPTQVPILSARNISSLDTSVFGEQPAFILATDMLKPDGSMLAPHGTPIFAQITTQPHRRLGREGKINVQFTRIAGTNLVFAPNQMELHGKNRRAETIAITILLTRLYLLRNGGDVMIPQGAAFQSMVQ